MARPPKVPVEPVVVVVLVVVLVVEAVVVVSRPMRAAYARYELRVPGFAQFAAESLKPKLDDVYVSDDCRPSTLTGRTPC